MAHNTINKRWYIGWRGNPQLNNGGYYVAYGQLSKTAAKAKEHCAYGSMTLTPYDTESEYFTAIERHKSEGYRVTVH